MIISLTGFMGCGKSSVGKKLSALLSCPYTDLDRYIEKKENASINEIFRTKGESYFRNSEITSLQELIIQHHRHKLSVISLGGGTLSQKECRDMISKDTVCLYLRTSPSKLADNLEYSYSKRPLLADIHANDKTERKRLIQERVSAILAEREHDYMETARYVLYTDGNNIAQTVRDIISILRLQSQVR